MEIEKQKQIILQILNSFKIGVESISAKEGPTATMFEIKPKIGVRISRIKNLTEEIAVGLCSDNVRFAGAIPGHGTVGIEVPNAERKLLDISEMLSCPEYVDNDMELPCIIGKDINNDNLVCDLATMPHLLIAGATGQGKSVCLNTILMSLMHKLTPYDMKLVLVDPKEVEFGLYKNKLLSNFLCSPVITNANDALNVLNLVAKTMDRRYGMLAEENVRNIKEYNASRKGSKKMPYIVVVIDEYGDLIMQSGKEMEKTICRIAQKARAVGIHLIISTQRPSVKIVTGDIKANFPTRIAFRMITSTDSRVILGKKGAEELLGKGDMIYFNGESTVRAQCAFTSTDFVKKSCDEIHDRFLNEYDSLHSELTLYEMSGQKAIDEAVKKAQEEKKKAMEEAIAKSGEYYDMVYNHMSDVGRKILQIYVDYNDPIEVKIRKAKECLPIKTWEDAHAFNEKHPRN